MHSPASKQGAPSPSGFVASLVARFEDPTWGTAPRALAKSSTAGQNEGQEIAEAMHVTRYTVQDHLKLIFEKVGVRSRREFVAQLFLQHCAPNLEVGAVPAADGWFRTRSR